MNFSPLLRPLALLGAAFTAACSHQSNPPYPRGSVASLYPREPRPILRHVKVTGRTLRVAQMSGTGHTPLLLIHGSPGDWQAWARYLDAPALSAFSPRIAVDRPGFGGSDPGAVIPDLRAQAALLAELIPAGPPAIVVGHSLGGPLVGWLLLDHPDKFCGGVIIAGSLSPTLEAPRWYNRLGDTWLAHRLAPPELMWANAEILALPTELKKLEPEWPRLRRPIILLQGRKDQLVDHRTADYADHHLPTAYREIIRIPDQGHFLLWTQPQTIIAAINRLHPLPHHR